MVRKQTLSQVSLPTNRLATIPIVLRQIMTFRLVRSSFPFYYLHGRCKLPYTLHIEVDCVTTFNIKVGGLCFFTLWLWTQPCDLLRPFSECDTSRDLTCLCGCISLPVLVTLLATPSYLVQEGLKIWI